jgi:ATP-dependent DNA helicase RecG
MNDLNSNISKINRVGATTAKRLQNIGIETVNDLLWYFPFRYEDFSRIVAIKDLVSGQSANIVGRIELIQNKRSPRRRMNITEALISDGTETLRAIWFNQPFIAKTLKVGDKVSLAGKADEEYGSVTMTSPIYEKIISGVQVHTQGIVPIYHLTANLTQKQLRYLIHQVINQASALEDWLPNAIIREQKLLTLCEAIFKIHFPKNFQEVEEAKKRLAFGELFLLQLQSQLIKLEIKKIEAEPIRFHEAETKKFVQSLPFRLTNDQRRAAWEIITDLEKPKPMSRLLEGEVGSGKTIVAVIAMLNAALGGKQTVLMAPTEILAIQHFQSISKILGNKISICLLTSSQFQISNFQFPNKSKIENHKISKNTIINSIKSGGIQIIIGTHALIQENIEFANLGLAIIDEQHRFGVAQRAKLLSPKSEKNPHLLSMTATPIPRSLALALYGDLDLSIIKEMPKDRKKIITNIVPEQKRTQAYEFIRNEIKTGRQVFVICPLIDISDKSGAKSVKAEFEKLDKNTFPELEIGILHGRMKSAEKDEMMKKFIKNEIKILVSTSVVEVGIDIPNASIMMIEGADRFGLAQLHQFRGRVGRSIHQSYCFLFSESSSPKTIKRLEAMTQHNDGFTLAKIDLRFRGPGEVFGIVQKGFPELQIASLFDYELMNIAKEEVLKLIKNDPDLNNWPLLKLKISIMSEKIHLE